jgi:nucleoside-diphosphate-sugar epimerase
MRVFLAGATGALGTRLIPQLRSRGHDVVGLTRSRPEIVQALGAEPAVGDALDRGAVTEAVAAAQPDVIVHQLTALSGQLDMRRFDRAFAATNRLRTEGTDNLLAAARAADVKGFVAQSFAGWPYARTGGPAKAEDDPLDPDPPRAFRATLDAIRHLETAVTAFGGIVLRYGGFYGPGTSFAADGDHLELVRRRRLPVVGAGAGVWSFVHIDDAAAATVAAIERGRPGIYNVVDDEPAAVSDWLPKLAASVGAKPPHRVPLWVARLVAGESSVVLMSEVRGASNRKARRELGWEPRWRTWREGFADGLAA